MNWEKRGNNIHSPRATFQNPNVESLDELGKLCPNLSFSVENKMENSHKKGWSHFKPKVFHSLKFSEFINEFGKIFSFGENRMNPIS